MFYYVFRPSAILPKNDYVFDYVSVKNDYVLLCIWTVVNGLCIPQNLSGNPVSGYYPIVVSSSGYYPLESSLSSSG